MHLSAAFGMDIRLLRAVLDAYCSLCSTMHIFKTTCSFYSKHAFSPKYTQIPASRFLYTTNHITQRSHGYQIEKKKQKTAL
jgi:hypothetical protein